MYQWTGNVGLVNVSDLLRASTNIACTSATDEFNAVMQEIPQETCGSYLTTFNEELGSIYYWTMNEKSRESAPDFSYSFNAWVVAFRKGEGSIGADNARTDRYLGARPVVFLKSSIQITGGDGTKSNPYIIA